MQKSRLERLQAALNMQRIEAAAVLPGPNLRYLTGADLHKMERPTVLFIRQEGAPFAVIPALEQNKLLDAAPYAIDTFPWSDADGPDAAFDAALGKLGALTVLGVESLEMRFQEMQLIKKRAPGVTFVPADAAFADVRQRKDAGEIAHLRRAINISQAALNKTLEQVQPGMTERQIGALLQMEIIRAGAEVGFIIVQGGEGSAVPHGSMCERPVKAGDLLLIDFGAMVEGYSADITRTFCMGGAEPAPPLREIHDLVQAANAAGRAMCKPGAAPQDVDRAARAVITEGGYGEQFIHRTGHGLGLGLHEEPYINEGNTTPLEPGNVFTIEPGIYLPGVGGVRIEDNMAITEDGADTLTTYPRVWSVVGERVQK